MNMPDDDDNNGTGHDEYDDSEDDDYDDEHEEDDSDADDALTAMKIPLGPLKLSIQPWCGKQRNHHTILHQC